MKKKQNDGINDAELFRVLLPFFSLCIFKIYVKLHYDEYVYTKVYIMSNDN